MKNLIAFLAFIMMSQANAQVPAAQVQVVQAQPQAPIVAQAAPVQAKKTLIYDERTNQLVEVAPPQAAQPAASSAAVASAPAATATSQPIYILNNQKLQGYQGAVQDAPTTVVQEAPARASASDTIRKERQGAEAATEDGIVQTLEKARLDDEVRRREKFNSALSTTSATSQSASATIVTAPAAPAAPVAAGAQAATATSIVNAQGAQGPVITTTTATNTEENEIVEVAPQAKPQKASRTRKKVILEDETTSSDSRDYRSEVRTAIAEERTAPLNLTQYYVAGQVGSASYNDYANIRGKLSSGVSLGMVTPERFVFEGSFMYSQFQVDDIAGPSATYQTLNMNQYNFSVAAKYQLLPGKLRPTVGAIAAYTRRNYSFAGSDYYGGSGSGDSILSTDALDAGLQAGLDLALTSNFSIGADFRYLWNIASKNSNDNVRGGYYYPNYSGYSNYGYNNYGGIKVVEDLSYYIATVSAKFTF